MEGASPALRKNMLIQELHFIKLEEFESEPCTNGGKHEITYEVLGDPRGTARSHDDPDYYLCQKCCKSYWPKFF